MKSVRIAVAGALVALASVTTVPVASAQEGAKIGFVNTERILRDAGAARDATRRLEAEFAKREKEVNDMGNRLKAMGDRLERDASVMSESDRQRRQREYSDLERDFQRRQREFREDLNQRRSEELARVVDRANQIIKQIAEAEGFDLIIQEAVVVSPRVDITDRVLQQLGGASARR